MTIQSVEQVGMEKEREDLCDEAKYENDEDGDVTIVLTRNKWNDALKAIENLMNFAQKEKEKEKEKRRTKKNEEKEETENVILDSIDTLFKHIFSGKQNESKNKNKNKRKNSYSTLKKQFCKHFDGIGYSYYERYNIKSLPSIVNDYQLIYNDFLDINIQLIDGKLKSFLLKHSNNKQDIDFLYNKIIRQRNICCMFPFKHCRLDWQKYNDDYISLIDQLNASKNDKIKMFCILYNCMVSVFVIGDEYEHHSHPGYGGLDRYIKHCVTTLKSDDIDLSSLCEWYILVEMAKTGIFGKDTKLDNCYGKEVYSSSVVSCIISNIFDNDLSSFKKLLKCCVQDIKFKNDIKKLRDIYANNNNKQGDFDYGIQFYVLNRLTYYVYHDLLLNISMKNDNVLLFPKLKNFFAFLYNFAVYCHCHLHLGADKNDKAECLLDYMC